MYKNKEKSFRKKGRRFAAGVAAAGFGPVSGDMDDVPICAIDTSLGHRFRQCHYPLMTVFAVEAPLIEIAAIYEYRIFTV